jgi:hypothetical protein
MSLHLLNLLQLDVLHLSDYVPQSCFNTDGINVQVMVLVFSTIFILIVTMLHVVGKVCGSSICGLLFGGTVACSACHDITLKV